ncbi:hypothetical protein BH23GEM6_BH23GEM6_02560 [soil metagenome]
MAITPQDDSGKPLALFAIQAGPRIGEELPINSPQVTIGSGNQNDLVIADDSVSTNHALLEYEYGGWRLTDLDSTNGTYVEGVKMAPQVPTPLPYGSSVRFGGLRLHLRHVPAADPESARAAFQPAERERTLAEERKTGFRMPLWILLVILLIVVAVAVGVFAWMHPGTQPAGTATPATPVEQPVAPQQQPPVPVAPLEPAIADTLPPDTLAPAAVDTVPAVRADNNRPEDIL